MEGSVQVKWLILAAAVLALPALALMHQQQPPKGKPMICPIAGTCWSFERRVIEVRK